MNSDTPFKETGILISILRSQETLKFHVLEMYFFLLYIVETSFGNAYTKF